MIPIIHSVVDLLRTCEVKRTSYTQSSAVDWLSLAVDRVLTHNVVVKIDRKFRANAIFVISFLESLRTALIRVEQFITLHTAL